MKRMNDTLIFHPKSSKMMAKEIVTAIEMYHEKDITETELRYFLDHYADHYGALMFESDNALNHTLRKILGKKRENLVLKLLSDRQLTLFTL